MEKKKQLNEIDKLDIIDSIDNNINKSVLARKYGVDPKTIYNIYANRTNVKRKKYDTSNRFKLTEQDKVDVLATIKKNSKTGLKELQANLHTQLSTDTIGRFLKRNNYATYRSKVKKNLSNLDKVSRLNYALKRVDWIEEWKNCVFTDETLVQNFANRKETFRCPIGERLDVTHYSKISKAKLSVNIYGFINHYHSRIFKVSKPFRGDDLFNLLNKNGVLNYICSLVPGEVRFVQDNSRVHKTPSILNLFEMESNIELVQDYPAYSPDLNPIEKIWAILKKSVSKKLSRVGNQITNEDQLFELCEQCFREIDQTTISRTIMEQIKVIKEVICLNGQMTRH